MSPSPIIRTARRRIPSKWLVSPTHSNKLTWTHSLSCKLKMVRFTRVLSSQKEEWIQDSPLALRKEATWRWRHSTSGWQVNLPLTRHSMSRRSRYPNLNPWWTLSSNLSLDLSKSLMGPRRTKIASKIGSQSSALENHRKPRNPKTMMQRTSKLTRLILQGIHPTIEKGKLKQMKKSKRKAIVV